MKILDTIKKRLGFKVDEKIDNKVSESPINRSSYFNLNELYRNESTYDIIATADHRIATAFAMVEFKSVLVDRKTKKTTPNQDSINDLLLGKINPRLTNYDFKYKICRMLLKNNDVFIWPVYKEVALDNGHVLREYESLLILPHTHAEIYPTEQGQMIHLTTKDAKGQTYDVDLPYADIIHWRLRYSEKELLGGDKSEEDLRTNVASLRTVVESIPKAINASLALNGIFTMTGMAEADKKELTREEFESHLVRSQFGIGFTDYEGNYASVNTNSKDIPPNTLDFVLKSILSQRGISLPIYYADYTADQASVFYNDTIGPLAQSFAEAMQSAMFTFTALKKGYAIRYYDRRLQALSMESKRALLETVAPSGLLSRDEQREIIGYEPDGKPDTMSLNWIETQYATAYQLGDKNLGKENNDAG